jgi:hypothetical protein
LGGGRDGGLFDLGQRHRPGGQQAEHNVDAAWDAAIAALPASDASRANAEQFGDAVLGDAERAECLARRRCPSGRRRLRPAQLNYKRAGKPAVSKRRADESPGS